MSDDPVMRTILEALPYERPGLQIDAVCERTSMGIREISFRLTTLQLNGLVIEGDGKHFVRV